MNPILAEAKESYESLSSFRKNRNRCKDFTFGRQWNDIIEVDGRKISEYEYILKEGNIPLKNNLIRRIVRNILGVFRKQLPEILDAMPKELGRVADANSLTELYCRTMEEFLISGMAVHRKGIGVRNGKAGVWTDMVSPSGFFFNSSARDIRGLDIDLIGQIHDVNFSQWCSSFVTDNASFARARKLFESRNKRVRVTEVWKKELRETYLVHDSERGVLLRSKGEDSSFSHIRKGCRKKWILEEVWRYYFLTDDGTVHREGDSPYMHRSHPFVVRAYPFIDGEIHSLIDDMIDQQKYTNRLITLYDWTIRASAKGVLLLPAGSVEPEEIQTVADQWGRFNGVIVYKADNGLPAPHQVNGNTANFGISELLDIQLKMLEDVSGVNGALQGNLSSKSISGTLYTQQTENALNSLSDILGSFSSFIKDCSKKDLSLLRQMSGNTEILSS